MKKFSEWLNENKNMTDDEVTELLSNNGINSYVEDGTVFVDKKDIKKTKEILKKNKLKLDVVEG